MNIRHNESDMFAAINMMRPNVFKPITATLSETQRQGKEMFATITYSALRRGN